MRRRTRMAVAVGIVGVVAGGAAAGALLLRPATPTTALGAPRFVDETAASGLVHRYDGDSTFSVGGGVAVLDCDDDGRPDLYLAGGAGPAGLFRNESPAGAALRFTRISDPVTDLTAVSGAYPIDLEGDGDADLVVLRAGESVVLEGLGDCRFEPASDALGFRGLPGNATAFSATWEGGARLPTIAVGGYLTLAPADDGSFACDGNVLLRPAPGGAGWGPPITLAPGYCALSMLFSDWDRSGRRDLRVSNDRHYYLAFDPANGQEQLWKVLPGEPPVLYTADHGWVQLQIEGMGIASHDLTGDGYPEVYLTSQAVNHLQTLLSGPSQPTYRDIGRKRGVEAQRPHTGGDSLPSTAWHPEFADVNDDGFVDLFVSKGNIEEQPDYAMRDPSNLLLGQPDGTFVEAAGEAGIVRYERGRGAALADFNLDGLLDLVQASYHADVAVWRNVGAGTAEQPAPMGNWTAVRLRQDGANRDAIGAWLEIRIGDLTGQRELTIGGGHLGGQLGWIHLGLGPAAGADVRVQWPDGEAGPWIPLEAGQFAIIERGAAVAARWVPAGG